VAVIDRPTPTSLLIPSQHRPSDLTAPFDHAPETGWPETRPETTPTAMTIAIVGESPTRWDAADTVASLAKLAASDELVMIYGSDEYQSAPGVQPLVAGLRQLLPRHTVVVLYAGPHSGPLLPEAALLDELLELGTLPIVVTPAAAACDVAGELYHRLRADRVLAVTNAQPSRPRAVCTGSAAPGVPDDQRRRPSPRAAATGSAHST
jgi:hypothetical protein